MKILQVANKVPYPSKDGGAIACMNLTKGFAALGHTITVLAMNTPKHHTSVAELPDNIKNLATFHFVDVQVKTTIGGAIFNLIFSKKPYNAARFIHETFSKKLRSLLEKEDFDVVQLEGIYLCPYIHIVRKYSKAKIVYRAHNIEHEIWERSSKMSSGLKKEYLKLLTKRIKRFETEMLNTYDLLVPISKRDGLLLDVLGNVKPQHISQTGIDRTELIPNTNNLEFPTLFFIGSLEWAPNQEGLLWFIKNCWPLLHKKYPDLKFYVAGRNAPLQIVKKLNKSDIIYRGEVENAYEFMNSKAIMAVPLFSGSGMRIKIIEGMALGKSIVSTAIGAEGIECSANKNILIANDPHTFVDAISSLINNRTLFEKIGKSAIDFIHDNFDNLAATKKLIEFYKQNTQ